jgi:hypothetical protein
VRPRWINLARDNGGSPVREIFDSHDQVDEVATWAHLTGGLGNQLFQLAAALFVSRGYPVGLISSFGAPRLNALGSPEITSLNLARDVRLQTASDSSFKARLIRKFINVCLTCGSRPESRCTAQVVTELTLKSCAVSLRRLLGKHEVLCSSNIGFDARILTCGRDSLLVGYFQTWRTAANDRVRAQIREMFTLSRGSPWVDSMRDLARREEPLVLHVRLGDYQLNPQFGKLQLDYFRQGLEMARHSSNVGRLWIFSDEPKSALQILEPLVSKANPRIIEVSSSTTSCDVMQVMSFGRSFVLSNSTFGWWAANLAEDQEAPVVVPTPWFVDGTVVRDLIPAGWNQLQRT